MNKQLSALKAYIEWFGAMHENCPGDDTCNCSGKELNEEITKLLTAPNYTTLRDLIKIYLEPLGDVEVEHDTFYSRVKRADSIVTALYAVMTELEMPERYPLLKVRLTEKI